MTIVLSCRVFVDFSTFYLFEVSLANVIVLLAFGLALLLARLPDA